MNTHGEYKLDGEYLYINVRRSRDGAFVRASVRSFVRAFVCHSVRFCPFYADCPHKHNI